MKLRPCLSICSSTTHRETPPPPPPPSKLLLLSDTTSNNISDATTTTTTNSLNNNHSLQKLSAETLTLSVSHLRHTSLKPLNFLAVHNHLLYAATGNLIHVIDVTSFTLLNTVNVAGSSSGSVKSVSFSNGNIFTAHQDKKIRVWKLSENKHHKHIATLPTIGDRILRSVLPKNYVNVRRHRKKLWIEHHDAVSGLALVTDHGSADRTVRIWQRERDGKFCCLRVLDGYKRPVQSLVVHLGETMFRVKPRCTVRVFSDIGDGDIRMLSITDLNYPSSMSTHVS
ncbi:hypothetical protein L6452_16997 [Arctium lappa]|uniref:Uncharacterized protein n=1 Tax=Arctium lappa TaxID=4217 RepID=A0ACB9C297_ARCLA|nr:hypothetical protein L6452_16997 [Arctium lappa]